MEQELVFLTRNVLERPPSTPLVGDECDRAVANENYELDHVARERKVARIRALREALGRMDAGTYGRCELCTKPIAPRRLAVVPETPFCVECARSLDGDATRRPLRRPLFDEEDC